MVPEVFRGWQMRDSNPRRRCQLIYSDLTHATLTNWQRLLPLDSGEIWGLLPGLATRHNWCSPEPCAHVVITQEPRHTRSARHRKMVTGAFLGAFLRILEGHRHDADYLFLHWKVRLHL